MLSSTRFSALSNRQKTDILSKTGTYLYTRQEPAFTIDGYKVNDFFVEIFFSKEEEPKAIFRSFNEGENSAFFLPEENIHYLYQYIVRSHTA